MKTNSQPARAKVGAINPPSLSSISLPLRFIVAGMAALLTAMVWLALRPEILATYHYNQYVIALTHLFNLGWISSIIMGAMYQMVPVALETRLYSPQLARWQFALHVIGFAGMVWMFWIWNLKWVGLFGSIFGAGVLLFIYNLARTLACAPRRTVTWTGIVSALGWLTWTMLAGLFLVATKCWGLSHFDTMAQMHAHAHAGVLGFFVMMIVGVSYKLVPMFTLSDVQSERRARWSIRLLNAGLAGLFVTILLQSRAKPMFGLLTLSGLLVYGLEMRQILRARKRRHLDWGLRYFLTALSLLAPVVLLGMVLSWPTLPLRQFTGQMENVYGFVALAGVVSLALLGMLYKIVPFLVWYGRYGGEIGLRKVPLLTELYSERLQAAGYWTFLAGLTTTSVATLLGNSQGVRAGCAVLAVSCFIFAANMGLVLSHLIRGKSTTIPQPLKARTEGTYVTS